MLRNKKALSTVVTTLIIVLLVLVAIGIIWAVIQNLIETSTDQIDLLTACPQVNLQVTAASCTEDGGDSTCSVTLQRKDSTNNNVAGAKLVFTDATGKSETVLFEQPIPALESRSTETALTIDDITEANKIEVYVEFTDGQTCPEPSDTYTSALY